MQAVELGLNGRNLDPANARWSDSGDDRWHFAWSIDTDWLVAGTSYVEVFAWPGAASDGDAEDMASDLDRLSIDVPGDAGSTVAHIT